MEIYCFKHILFTTAYEWDFQYKLSICWHVPRIHLLIIVGVCKNYINYIYVLSIHSDYGHLFPCNRKYVLMSALLFCGFIACMKSKKKNNLKFLYLGQINKPCSLSSKSVIWRFFFSIQLLFPILVILARVQIMEHVRMCRVMLLVFVHQSIQDLHVKVIYLRSRHDKARWKAVLLVVMCSGSFSRDCRVCTWGSWGVVLVVTKECST